MIKVLGHVSIKKKEKGAKKISTFEVEVDGAHRLFNAYEIIEKSGAKRTSQTKKIEAWFNSDEGREYVANTKDDISYFIALYGSENAMIDKFVGFLTDNPDIAIGPTMKTLVEQRKAKSNTNLLEGEN